MCDRVWRTRDRSAAASLSGTLGRLGESQECARAGQQSKYLNARDEKSVDFWLSCAE
jgi:hypothetical protein